MANTRDFKSLGVVASDATPVTEDGERTVGDSYRRTNLSDAQQVAGELFDVNPRTEFLNQKLLNQSSFTDLIDSRGFPGWNNLVDYSKPAVVWASDGLPGDGDFYFCLKDNGPSSFIVDPLSDNQENPIYWRIMENSQQLRLELTDETPGDEGSRLIGHNYIDVNGGSDEGLEVKQALDNAYLALVGLRGIEILAFAVVFAQIEPIIPPFVQTIGAGSSFNIEAGNISVIDGLDGAGDPTGYTQGLDIVFTNPIPASYNVQVCGQMGFVGYVTDNSGVGQLVSYRNNLTTGVEIYHKYYPTVPPFESVRQTITFSLTCYRYNP